MDRELQKLSKYNKDTIVDIAAEVCYLSSEAMLLDAQSFFYHNLSFVGCYWWILIGINNHRHKDQILLVFTSLFYVTI